MYESFFGLDEPAFSVTPDPRFLWPSETHEEGLSALCYGIVGRKGFILLTGEVGAGKTTLLRAAIDRIPKEFVDFPETAMILNTVGLDPLDLLKLICAEFGVIGLQAESPRRETTADYIIVLQRFLLERLRNGGNTVLIIDEAQNLTPAVLEQVRLLSNLETDSHKLLQIVLTGQPELRRTLARTELRQLRQRIAIEHHVEPLRPADILPYLRHRIEVAGGRYEEIFSDGVESVFFDFSRGCPRLLNLLADRVLLSAYAKKTRPVPLALVEEKAKEMAADRDEGRRTPKHGKPSGPSRHGKRRRHRKRSNG
jgi:general secretion pathway protein A